MRSAVRTGGRQEPSGHAGAGPYAFDEERPANQGVAGAHGSQQEASGWIGGRSLRPKKLRTFRRDEKRDTRGGPHRAGDDGGRVHDAWSTPASRSDHVLSRNVPISVTSCASRRVYEVTVSCSRNRSTVSAGMAP